MSSSQSDNIKASRAVLHLLGNRQDIGGILSVLRNLQPYLAGRWTPIVLVNKSFRETRTPSLEYRYASLFIDEDNNHASLLLRAIAELPRLVRLTRGQRFDVVHGHTRGALFLGIAWAYMERKRFLFTNHTYGRRIGLYRWAASLNRVRMVLLTPNMARYYSIHPLHNKIDIISACCNSRFFELPVVERAKCRRPVKIVGVGTLERWKRWHLVLEAIARLPQELRQDVYFYHYGPANTTSSSRSYSLELRELAGRLNLTGQVHFCGQTDRIEGCLVNADLFVLPSINEPCSVALIEALALGVPVLVSRSGGNVDIVQDGKTGLLFRVDDIEDLVAKLVMILRGDVEFLPPVQIRQAVLDRHPAVVAEQYAKVYQQMSTC